MNEPKELRREELDRIRAALIAHIEALEMEEDHPREMAKHHTRMLLVLAGSQALRSALTNYPNAHIVSFEEQTIAVPLLDLERFAAAPCDGPPSRGPKARRKFPVRR